MVEQTENEQTDRYAGSTDEKCSQILLPVFVNFIPTFIKMSRSYVGIKL